jgi:hypothetical protein
MLECPRITIKESLVQFPKPRLLGMKRLALRSAKVGMVLRTARIHNLLPER